MVVWAVLGGGGIAGSLRGPGAVGSAGRLGEIGSLGWLERSLDFARDDNLGLRRSLGLLAQG